MKCLFVKNKYTYGGPWASFNYNEVTPKWILERTYAKAGHPFPMICNYQMDCRIINTHKTNSPWEQELYRGNPHAQKLIETLTEGTCGWGDIDFSSYDLVYSEDPIIPPNIINQHRSRVQFVFNRVEHWSETKHADGYVFVDHQNVPFPQCPDAVSDFCDREIPRIHIEYRTNQITNIHEQLAGLGLELVYKKNTSLYMIEKNPESGLEYWSRLGKSRYNVQLPAPQLRLGQGLGDSAAAGCINIGDAKCEVNRCCVYPNLRTQNLGEAMNHINKLESDLKFRCEVLEYQYDMINKRNKMFHKKITG